MADDKITYASIHGLKIGDWCWIKDKKDKCLACVTWIGTNFVEFNTINYSTRIHDDDLHKFVLNREYNPDDVINANVNIHSENVKRLLSEVKQLTAKLSITPNRDVVSHDTTNSLMVLNNYPNVEEYKANLIKAKDEQLPILFKKIKEENDLAVTWMKAHLIPLRANTDILKKQTDTIDDKIFTVELYAGLCESTVKIKSGKAADSKEKIHLFQRRHYMDEECLANYRAGGMEFKDIGAFDKWLTHKENLNRILPFPKCIVAFRIRRFNKEREAITFSDFISLQFKYAEDKTTFLYIRNGDNVHRLNTQVQFEEQLFPDNNHMYMSGEKLYINGDSSDVRIITEHEYLGKLEEYKRSKAQHQKELKEYESLSDELKKAKHRPYFWDRMPEYDQLDHSSINYDRAMDKIAKDANKHNKIAMILQGLLDRSDILHPHPAWRLWESDDFNASVELHFDETRAIHDGDKPDFEAYRKKLNASIKVGSNTVGQQDEWMYHEAIKENERQGRDYRIRNPIEYSRYSPYGNPGPGLIAQVVKFNPIKGICHYKWSRERSMTKWIDNPQRPGYMMVDKSGVPSSFKCSVNNILNVDAYTPGDYKQFYSDPRTRMEYLKWAPLLLAAEDFYAKK